MKKADYPALYQDADAASLRAQDHFLSAVAASLCLLMFTGILSLWTQPVSWLAVIQAFALLLSIGLTIYLAYDQPQRRWYGTRALAESVKTITWRFMMRAEPYNIEDAKAQEAFVSTLRNLIKDNQFSEHATALAPGDQVTSFMRDIRRKRLSQRKEFYDEERVVEQRRWYRTNAKLNKDNSRKWFLALVTAQGLAIISAVARVWLHEWEFWPTDVFVAAAAAALAWSQTKHFEELTASYSLTAHDINSLQARLRAISSESDFSSFVGDAENAFSREHTQWRARRDVL